MNDYIFPKVAYFITAWKDQADNAARNFEDLAAPVWLAEYDTDPVIRAELMRRHIGNALLWDQICDTNLGGDDAALKAKMKAVRTMLRVKFMLACEASSEIRYADVATLVDAEEGLDLLSFRLSWSQVLTATTYLKLTCDQLMLPCFCACLRQQRLPFLVSHLTRPRVSEATESGKSAKLVSSHSCSILLEADYSDKT